MLLYVTASLSPAVLLAAAALWGGWLPLAALLWITLAVYLLDRAALTPPSRDVSRLGVRALPLLLAFVHLGLMPLVVVGVTRQGPAASAALLLAAGLLFGQLANSNAHELIHRSPRWQRILGATIYVALLFGHHTSAHRLVHHVHVASDADPNSARVGESFYRFWPRAWLGSFRAGLAAVNRQRAKAAIPRPAWSHPYLWYVAGGAGALAVAFAIGGLGGLLAWLLICMLAQMQLLLADYVQHYGLRRGRRADGSLEPAGDSHSWNAGQVWSGAMMLNAPRHSDHHRHPARAFADLRLDPGAMPVLPGSLPAMAFTAMIPPLWRRRMHPRLADLRADAALA